MDQGIHHDGPRQCRLNGPLNPAGRQGVEGHPGVPQLDRVPGHAVPIDVWGGIARLNRPNDLRTARGKKSRGGGAHGVKRVPQAAVHGPQVAGVHEQQAVVDPARQRYSPRIASPSNGRPTPMDCWSSSTPGDRASGVAAREDRTFHLADAEAELGEPGTRDAPGRASRRADECRLSALLRTSIPKTSAAGMNRQRSVGRRTAVDRYQDGAVTALLSIGDDSWAGC